VSNITFVIVGASNLTLSLPGVLRSLINMDKGKELTTFIAHGPGRSYGEVGGLPGWRWPGHVQTELLTALDDHLQEQNPGPVHALFTDVGNDIPYGAEVSTISSWVERLISEMRARNAKVGITSLPVESVLRLPEWKFRLVLKLLFPGRSITRDQVFTRIQEVQREVESVARRQEALLLPSRPSWYGRDHFHLRSSARDAVFHSWINCVREISTQEECNGHSWDDLPPAPRAPWIAPWIRLKRCAEEYRFGRKLTSPQPGKEVAPGVKLCLY